MRKFLDPSVAGGYRQLAKFTPVGTTGVDAPRRTPVSTVCSTVLNLVKNAVNGARLCEGHSILETVIENDHDTLAIVIQPTSVGVAAHTGILLTFPKEGSGSITLTVSTVEGEESSCDVTALSKFQSMSEFARAAYVEADVDDGWDDGYDVTRDWDEDDAVEEDEEDCDEPDTDGREDAQSVLDKLGESTSIVNIAMEALYRYHGELKAEDCPLDYSGETSISLTNDEIDELVIEMFTSAEIAENNISLLDLDIDIESSTIYLRVLNNSETYGVECAHTSEIETFLREIPGMVSAWEEFNDTVDESFPKELSQEDLDSEANNNLCTSFELALECGTVEVVVITDPADGKVVGCTLHPLESGGKWTAYVDVDAYGEPKQGRSAIVLKRTASWEDNVSYSASTIAATAIKILCTNAVALEHAEEERVAARLQAESSLGLIEFIDSAEFRDALKFEFLRVKEGFEKYAIKAETRRVNLDANMAVYLGTPVIESAEIIVFNADGTTVTVEYGDDLLGVSKALEPILNKAMEKFLEPDDRIN